MGKDSSEEVKHPIMRLVLLACLVLALVITSVHSSEQTNQPSQQKQKRASSPQSQAAPRTAASGVVGQPAPEAVEKGKTEKQTYWQQVLSPEILPNWLLFFIGAFGIYTALRTLKDLERQTANFRAVAEAAKKSADVAEQALQISQRADVLLIGATVRRGEVLNVRDWSIEVEFKNFGLTRANNVRLSLDLFIEGAVFPPTTLPPITMGAGDNKILTFNRVSAILSDSIAGKVFRAELPFRFEGKAVYEDVFGKTHATKSSGTMLPHSGSFTIDRQESD